MMCGLPFLTWIINFSWQIVFGWDHQPVTLAASTMHNQDSPVGQARHTTSRRVQPAPTWSSIELVLYSQRYCYEGDQTSEFSYSSSAASTQRLAVDAFTGAQVYYAHSTHAEMCLLVVHLQVESVSKVQKSILLSRFPLHGCVLLSLSTKMLSLLG